MCFECCLTDAEYSACYLVAAVYSVCFLAAAEPVAEKVAMWNGDLIAEARAALIVAASSTAYWTGTTQGLTLPA